MELAVEIGRADWLRLAIEILGVEVGWKNFRDDPSGYRYRVEYFGFNDGISQPFADLNLGPPPPGGGTPRPGGTWDPIAPGELLLGLPDEDGLVQDRPCNATLRNNGTYMAFRSRTRTVIGFRQFVADHDAGALPTQSKFASQMFGRWANGTPIAISPNGPRPYSQQLVAGEINDFRYQRQDPLGQRCPIAAHVRRAKIRATPTIATWSAVTEFGEERFPMAGRKFWKIPDGDGRPRGLLFVALNARIDQQFELLQRSWLNTGEFVGQVGAHRCPVLGNNKGGIEDQFIGPERPAPITNLSRFVKLRGGEYFLCPRSPR